MSNTILKIGKRQQRYVYMCVYIHTYIHTHVCMYVCMYVCMTTIQHPIIMSQWEHVPACRPRQLIDAVGSKQGLYDSGCMRSDKWHLVAAVREMVGQSDAKCHHRTLIYHVSVNDGFVSCLQIPPHTMTLPPPNGTK